jgi:integrase
MALRLRGGIYYTDFTVNGERIRQTLETGDWREATQKERDLVSRAKQGKLATGVTAELARQPFEQALNTYLQELAIYRADHNPDPRKSWEGRLTAPLRPFFRAKRLSQITADDVRSYQAKRLREGRHPNTANHEVKGLLRLLKRAKLASRIRDDVSLLHVQRESRELLTPAEIERLFATAATKPRWQTAFCAAMLTATTTMRPVELRRLEWKDLDPENRTIIVRRSKTEAGSRLIPLNDEAWSAITALKREADRLKAYALENFIFPRTCPRLDASKPMGASGWKTAWHSLCREAGKADKKRNLEESPRLTKLRYYDLRHLAITLMLEAGIPEGIIRDVAGHIDPAMTRHYSHPRLAARRAAVQAISILSPGQNQATPAEGYVTNHVTKQLSASTGSV